MKVEKFTIEVEMGERWVPHFMSFLKKMENNGKSGCSRLIGFYSDGDGDFQPKFKSDISFERVEPHDSHDSVCHYHYDAG